MNHRTLIITSILGGFIVGGIFGALTGWIINGPGPATPLTCAAAAITGLCVANGIHYPPTRSE